MEKGKKFNIIAEICFPLIIAAFVVTGRSINNYHSLFGITSAPFESLLVFLAVFFPGLVVFLLLGRKLGRKTESAEEERKNFYNSLPVITFLFVTLTGIVALLSFFPGILGYDSEWQTLQAYDLLPLSNHHPVLHTLIWNLFIAFEWLGLPHPYGLVLYCMMQVVAVGIVCSYVVLSEIREGCKWPVMIITMLFYGLYPAFSVFSVEMTKDVLFSCVVVLLFLSLMKTDRKKVHPVKICILVILGCLLRNNFLPAACGLVVFLLVSMKRKKNPKLLIASFTGVVLSVITLSVIYPAAGVASTESHEILSVPVNQLSAVYVHRYDQLSIAERFLIEEYMEAGRYNPRLADSVKFTFADDLYDSDTSAFWDLYFHLLYKYPDEFINAFLTQNVQLWYPGAAVFDKYAARKYVETENVFVGAYPVVRNSKLPGLAFIYEDIFTRIENGGVIEALPFSLAIPFYTMILGMFIAIKRKRHGFGAAVFMALCLWGTYLLGPVSAFRYMYPFFLLIPVIVTPLFSHEKSYVKEA